MRIANKRGMRAYDDPPPPVSLLGLNPSLYHGDAFDMTLCDRCRGQLEHSNVLTEEGFEINYSVCAKCGLAFIDDAVIEI